MRAPDLDGLQAELTSTGVRQTPANSFPCFQQTFSVRTAVFVISVFVVHKGSMVSGGISNGHTTTGFSPLGRLDPPTQTHCCAVHPHCLQQLQQPLISQPLNSNCGCARPASKVNGKGCQNAVLCLVSTSFQFEGFLPLFFRGKKNINLKNQKRFLLKKFWLVNCGLAIPNLPLAICMLCLSY